jgi:hypothetical protein
MTSFRFRGRSRKSKVNLSYESHLKLAASELIECSRGISEVEKDYLKITIPEWLAGMLRIDEGSLVSVDNRNGRCNIHPIDPARLQ